jgi:signal transduction histidine kinase
MATPPSGFQPAPLPPDEAERLRALHRTALLDSAPDPRLNRLADMAARLLGRPIGLVSLVDRDRQFLVARCGIDATQTGRDEAFCAHAILDDGIFEVLDTHTDPRFAGNPLVVGPPHIRAYVGKPLIDSDGYRLGTLCVIDRVPRHPLTEAERTILIDLAAVVADLIQCRATALTAESERQRADRVLRLKDDYLASMAHELRTPLNAVTGFGQLLKMTGAEAALTRAQADYLNTIVESAEYLALLVNETLDSHADQAEQSGGGRLRSDPVEIAPIMNATKALIRPLADRQRVTVTVEPAGTLAVWADPLRLRQVLINLVSNAVKYNRPGGSVRLRAEADENGQTVRVTCEDTGLGIPEKDLPKLFNAYFRVAETADEIEGSGLGLRITRRLVAMMGGTLTVASREGEGSTFTVTLSRQV